MFTAYELIIIFSKERRKKTNIFCIKISTQKIVQLHHDSFDKCAGKKNFLCFSQIIEASAKDSIQRKGAPFFARASHTCSDIVADVGK